MTGGERPTQEQQQACNSLCSSLIELLAAMPLDQSLLHACDREQPTPPIPPRRNGTSTTRKTNVEAHSKVGDGDLETEATRRRMREEARSAVLRALATLLAGCDVGTRRAAAGYRAPGPGGGGPRAQSGKVFMAAAPANGAFVRGAARATADGDCAVGIDCSRSEASSSDNRSSVPDLPQMPEVATGCGGGSDRGLVSLCLELLSWCGGAAEPKAKIVRVGTDVECDGVVGGATGRRGVPTGRKAELLKVIGNACFRCKVSQDLVRELGALPLILNHCAVDGGNPLLR